MLGRCVWFVLLLGLTEPRVVRAETGYDMWLRYAPLDEVAAASYRRSVPPVVVALGQSAPLFSARDELVRGISGMLGRTERIASALPDEDAIVLGTVADLRRAAPGLAPVEGIPLDGFHLGQVRSNGWDYTVIAAANDRGVLYGTFGYLRKIALHESIAATSEVALRAGDEVRIVGISGDGENAAVDYVEIH